MSESSETQSSGALPPRWALKLITKTHVALHRLTGGRYFNTLNGDEVCFVTMTGAKSGKQITIPLMYVPYQDGVVIVASQGGAPKNPVWYSNLVKHPDIEVNHRGKRMKLRARQASDAEREQIWPVCDSHYAPFAEYRARTDRKIPIFVCEPRS